MTIQDPCLFFSHSSSTISLSLLDSSILIAISEFFRYFQIYNQTKSDICNAILLALNSLKKLLCYEKTGLKNDSLSKFSYRRNHRAAHCGAKKLTHPPSDSVKIRLTRASSVAKSEQKFFKKINIVIKNLNWRQDFWF